LLSDILSGSPVAQVFPNLLVGKESSDDAAVYRINDTQAIVATTDFFMPIVDDPFDFGRIAATNAISDIYAMGAKPFMALALLGVPVGKLPLEAVRGIIAGGEAVCAQVGIPIAGGHSIDSPEPIYGLVALGLIHPDKVKRNDRARAGDVIILGKGLGVGIMSAALKKSQLNEESYRDMIAATTQLNTPGIALAELAGVHALTDITGFGLLGHVLEICRGSRLRAKVAVERIPVLKSVRALIEAGFVTGASERNWMSYRESVRMPPASPDWQQKLLTDPQTSGGLLVACEPQSAKLVLEIFAREGFNQAAVIGELEAGESEVVVS